MIECIYKCAFVGYHVSIKYSSMHRYGTHKKPNLTLILHGYTQAVNYRKCLHIRHSKTLINTWGMYNWNPFMHCSGSIDGTAESLVQSSHWHTLV